MIRTTSLVLALVLGGCFKKPPETPVEAGQTTVEVVDADQAPTPDEPELTAAERRGSRAPVAERVDDAASLIEAGTTSSLERAARILEEAVAEEPDSIPAQFNLGVARYRLGQDAAAQAAWEDVIARDPSLGDAWLYLGVLKERTDRYDLAEQNYRTGIGHDRENMELHVALISALRKQGRVDEAIAAATEALGINANSLAVYNNLGLAYLDQQNYGMAKFVFQKALNSIAGAPDNAYIQCNLGWTLYLQGDKGPATFHLLKAVELDPDLVPANIYLARLYLENRNYVDMVPLLERAALESPENHGVQMNLGIAYRGMGRFDEAKAAWTKALSLDPSNPDPWFNLGILYGDNLKDYDASIDAFEKYITAGGAQEEQAREYIKEVKKERKKSEKLKKAEEERLRKEREREERQRLLREAEEAAARGETIEEEPLEQPPADDAPDPGTEPEAPGGSEDTPWGEQ